MAHSAISSPPRPPVLALDEAQSLYEEFRVRASIARQLLAEIKNQAVVLRQAVHAAQLGRVAELRCQAAMSCQGALETGSSEAFEDADRCLQLAVASVICAGA